MKRPSWPEVTGPLQPYAAGYRNELSTRLGYSRWSASAHMYLLADVSANERVARLFLVKCAPEPAAPGCGVERLGVEVINAFLLGECARIGVGSANRLVTALRALLRFFYLQSYTADSRRLRAPGRRVAGQRQVAGVGARRREASVGEL